MTPTLPLWIDETMHGLPCRVLLPDPYRPDVARYPLVVALHGSGERGTDNVAQLKNGLATFERARAAIVVAPQLPRSETFGGSWYGGDSAGQRKVVAIARELAGRRSVDAARVYGVGFSMGAIGLWDVLTRHRDVFTAAVLIAGDLDVEAARDLADFPLRAVHGSDDRVVPPTNTRRFAAHVAAVGGRAQVTMIDGVGHDVWRHAFADDAIWEWLFAQRR